MQNNLKLKPQKVVVKDREHDHEMAVQSSYQALEAFKRRGLAMDFSGIMSFVTIDTCKHSSII
jgi:Fe2+ or Zn2+ uptake regulation protein